MSGGTLFLDPDNHNDGLLDSEELSLGTNIKLVSRDCCSFAPEPSITSPSPLLGTTSTPA